MGNDMLNKRRLSIRRLAATGAIAAGIFYILCWIGAQLRPVTLSHMYLGLFTKANPASTAALGEGILWSLIFGLISGGLIAAVYNALSPLERAPKGTT